MISEAGKQQKDSMYKMYIAIKSKNPNKPEYKELDRLFQLVDDHAKSDKIPNYITKETLQRIMTAIKEVQ